LTSCTSLAQQENGYHKLPFGIQAIRPQKGEISAKESVVEHVVIDLWVYMCLTGHARHVILFAMFDTVHRAALRASPVAKLTLMTPTVDDSSFVRTALLCLFRFLLNATHSLRLEFVTREGPLVILVVIIFIIGVVFNSTRQLDLQIR